MTRQAQIRAGAVVNVILADAGFDPGDGSTLVASDTAQIGDTYDGTRFTTPSTSPVYQTTGLTFLQFMALFTPSEQQALVNSNDDQIKLFNLMAAGATQIDLTNQEVVTGVNYAASQNLIAGNRVSAILAGQPPA